MPKKKTSKTPSAPAVDRAAPCSPRSSREITLPKNGIYNNDLVCNLRGITLHREAVIMFLPKGDCTDMSGAIKLATGLHPKCKRVVTISGDAVDRVYQMKGRQWKSFVVASTPAEVNA
jgi:hypothetical protein